MSLLEATGLRVTFGGVTAVDGVDLAVESGEVVGLIGPNGAGKTTLIDALCGFVPSSGQVQFAGADISGWPAHQRARAGVARSFQTIELFEDLTVADNLRVAARRPRWWAPLVDLVAPRRGTGETTIVGEILATLDLEDMAERLPTELSHGQRNLASVARALCMSPQLVFLDEPAAGLDSDETALLVELVRSIAATGIAAVLVDHDMDLVLPACDRIAVLVNGSVIADGTPSQVRHDRAVVDAYLGEAAE